MMRIVFFGNNRVGVEVLRWLLAQGEEVCGIVLHPEDRIRCGDELRDLSTASPVEVVVSASDLHDPAVIDRIAALRPTVGVSAFFGYILRAQILDLFPRGSINIHPSLLPFNRGANPNVWSIVEGTPAGVSIHYMESQVDAGDVIAQRVVDVEPVDTGGTLYRKLEQGCIDLFKATWPSVREGEVLAQKQPREVGSYHLSSDLAEIDHVRLDRTYEAGQLIDILRARTFPPYPGAYFVHEGRKVYMRLDLTYEGDPGEAR